MSEPLMCNVLFNNSMSGQGNVIKIKSPKLIKITADIGSFTSGYVYRMDTIKIFASNNQTASNIDNNTLNKNSEGGQFFCFDNEFLDSCADCKNITLNFLYNDVNRVLIKGLGLLNNIPTNAFTIELFEVINVNNSTLIASTVTNNGLYNFNIPVNKGNSYKLTISFIQFDYL